MTGRKALESTTEATLGVIMLNTSFPRVPGDIGNADTFCCNVIYETVEAADVAAVVNTKAPCGEVSAAIVDAALALQRRGASVIATSCGFLGIMHDDLVDRLSVPLISTALLHLAWLHKVIPHVQPVGVLTFDASALTEQHFANLWRDDIVIAGLDPAAELRNVIGRDLPTLDTAKAQSEVLALASGLLARHPDLGAIVLECTNLVPYKPALRQLTHKPIFDITDLIAWSIGEACVAPLNQPSQGP
jgi:aspartate/glutamate racemase